MKKMKWSFALMMLLTLLCLHSVLGAEKEIVMRDAFGEECEVAEYFETQYAVTFELDAACLKEDEKFVYRMSKNGGENFGTLLPVEDSELVVSPCEDEEQIKICFYIYASENNVLRLVKGNQECFGIRFTKGKEPLEIRWEYQKAERQLPEILCLTGSKPVLYVESAPIGKTYVSVKEGENENIYPVTNSFQMLFEQGQYLVDVFEMDEKEERIHAQNFPMEILYDQEGPVSMDIEVEAENGQYFEQNNTIYANSPISVQAYATDILSGIWKYNISLENQKLEDKEVELPVGYVGGVAVQAFDGIGNESAMFQCREKFVIENNPPEVNVHQSTDEGALELTISIKDSDSGLKSLMMEYQGETLREENYEETSEAIYERKLKISIPSEQIPLQEEDILLSAYDLAGNEKKLRIPIQLVDRIKPMIRITGCKNGEICSGNVGLTIRVSDLHLISNETHILMERKNTTTLETLEKREMNAAEEFVFTQNGKYEILITANDVGNNHAEQKFLFYIDQDAPIISGIKELQGKRFETFCLKEQIKELVHDESVVQYHLYLNGRDYSEEENIEQPGKYTIQVYALDQAGNMSQDQAEFLVNNKEVSENRTVTTIKKTVITRRISENLAKQTKKEKMEETIEKEKTDHTLVYLAILICLVILIIFLYLIKCRITEIDSQNEI